MNNYVNVVAILIIYMLFSSACSEESIEGVYQPACPSFAGDTITLRDGAFVWDKFTDQVLVDKDGQVVDQFPHHPVAGRYEVDEGALTYRPDAGTAPPHAYLALANERLYLLTAEEHAAWQREARTPACGLVRGGIDEN